MAALPNRAALNTDKDKRFLENQTNQSNSSTESSGRSVMAAPILSSSHSSATRKSIVVLRTLFVGSLVLVVVICFSVTFSMIRDLEEQISVQTYESVALGALDAASTITQRKIHVGRVMESIMAHAFPEADMWPMVGLNGYQETATTVASQSGDTSVALIVLVDPSEAVEFEAHAKHHYTSQGYPEDAGAPEEVGFGIRIRNSEASAGYAIDHSGNVTTYGSKNVILTPVLDHSSWASRMLMYNVHVSSTAVDSIIECTKSFKATENETTPSCSVITGFKLTGEGDLVALIYRPIYPENDPSTLVGMMGLSVNFKDVLVNVVPDYFGGVTAVLSTRTRTVDHSTIEYDTVTYEMYNGKPVLVGEGDHHDMEFDDFGHGVVLNDFHTDAADAVEYTLTFYPSSLDQFKTKSPVGVSMGFVFVILMSTTIFFLYDYLMRRQSSEQKLILGIKRRFVRFISHEIRTPLNTVCMGLELLESDMHAHQPRKRKEEASESSASEHLDGTVEEKSLAFWHDITVDIQENASSAVGILNDLLNYDKIESGTLQLEVSTVNINEVVIKAVRKFKVQAVNKDVSLDLKILPCKCTLFPGRYTISDPLGNGPRPSVDGDRSHPTELDNIFVLGDEMRLGQVVCNLVSNALKFTSSGGYVTVYVEHLSAPDCTPLRRHSEVPGSSRQFVTCHRPQRGTVRISVKDSGVGMTRLQLSQLFTEGLQFDPNKLQGGGGSGLGLSISKGIVDIHNGFINAASEGPESGSIFTVELPLYSFTGPGDENGVESCSCGTSELQSLPVQEALRIALDGDDGGGGDDAVASSTTSATIPSTQDCDGISQSHGASRTDDASKMPRHILVVEDVISSQKMLIRLLERAGCTCKAACDGQEAVAAVQATLARDDDTDLEGGAAKPFDTILMDYEMPVMNGPDATEKIRDLGYQGLILGVTGNVLAEDVEFFVSKGADSVVAKPVSTKVLKEVWGSPHPHVLQKYSCQRPSRAMLRKYSSKDDHNM